MKIALVLALARYFHSSDDEDVKRTPHLIIPTILMGIPVGLIIVQPDLGTALMLVFVTVCVFWIVGVQWWKFALVGLCGLGTVPIVWHFLHDYQKSRVLTFLNLLNALVQDELHLILTLFFTIRLKFLHVRNRVPFLICDFL